MKQDNPYDLSKLRVDPAELPRKRSKRKKWERHFVRTPWDWVLRLLGTKHAGSVYPLVYLLLYEHWRTGGRPIVLSNVLAAEVKLSPRSKWRALAELERLKLIQVERGSRKSPRLTLYHLPHKHPRD